MTISSALQNAMSGLRAAGRATDVIANNISNAATEGYARREIDVSSTSKSNHGGVKVNGVIRVTDPAITSARRNAQADHGYAETISGFASRLETTLGTPDDPRALTNQIADFDAALLTASSRPDAEERLTSTIETARGLTETLNAASEAVSDMRGAADSSIDAQVTRLNGALGELKQLNTQIAQTNISGRDDSGLLDLRQTLIDEIHAIVPVNTAARDHGQVALYTQGGAILIDGNPVEIGFTAARGVTPYQTIEGGQLSGLTANGVPLRTSSHNAHISGGTLAAQFEIRDELGTEALSQLDAVARDIITRFQDPAMDPSLTATDAGLFTDEGLFFDPTNEQGLASRLSLNAAVDPQQGGEVWRLRDGLGATTPGPVGQSALLDSMRDALTDLNVPASGDFGTGPLSLSDLANSLMGRVGVQRLSAEQSLSFSAASLHETSQAELAFGVDTDAELQMLVVIEQLYAANARMIDTINEMMDTLMRIGE